MRSASLEIKYCMLNLYKDYSFFSLPSFVVWLWLNKLADGGLWILQKGSLISDQFLYCKFCCEAAIWWGVVKSPWCCCCHDTFCNSETYNYNYFLIILFIIFSYSRQSSTLLNLNQQCLNIKMTFKPEIVS